MASEVDQARSMAERIARRVSNESTPGKTNGAAPDLASELAAMHSSLEELQRRLHQIERKVRSGGSEEVTASEVESQPPLRTHSPWLAGINASNFHPSQERFDIEEATVTELVDFFQSEKRCTMEPGGKPCDHCEMCSSRGF